MESLSGEYKPFVSSSLSSVVVSDSIPSLVRAARRLDRSVGAIRAGDLAPLGSDSGVASPLVFSPDSSSVKNICASASDSKLVRSMTRDIPVNLGGGLLSSRLR